MTDVSKFERLQSFVWATVNIIAYVHPGGGIVLPAFRRILVASVPSVYSKFQASFLEGENPPAQKTFSSPQTAAKLCALTFFGRNNELQIYHRNFLLIAIKQPKCCKFMPKMHQNTLTRSPRPPSRDGGRATSKGRREGRREETTAVSVRTKLTLFSLRSNLDLIDDVGTVGYVVCWQYPVGLAWLRGPLLVSQAAQDSAA